MLQTFIFPQSNNSITVDGTINTSSGDTWSTTNERFSTSTGATVYAYITWDASNIYVAWPQTDFDGYNQACYIVIDTDPQADPNQKSGNGASNLGFEQWSLGSTVTAPFNADYILMVKENNSSLEEHAWYHDGSWRKNGANSTTDHRNSFSEAYGNASGNFKDIEFSISRSALGIDTDGDDIYMIIYCKNLDNNSGWGYLHRAVGKDGVSDGTGDKTWDSNDYYGFNLTSGVNPNASGNLDQSLPVELTSFTATPQKGAVKLNWVTESEIDNLGFLIDRSLEPNSGFTTVADYRFVPELQGQGSVTYRTDYSYTDRQVATGTKYYYVLSDVTGNPEHGEPVTRHTDKMVSAVPDRPEDDLAIIKGFRMFNNYPNPINPKTTFSYDLVRDGEITLTIYNIAGRKVEDLYSGFQTTGPYEINWHPQAIPAGVYFGKLTYGDRADIQKLIFLK